jgi:Zn-dependent peptidase ImmA (M78 family)
MATGLDIVKRSIGRNTKQITELERLRHFLQAETTRLRSEAQCDSPPFDAESIAEFLGVEVEEREMPGIDGYVEIRDNRYVAVISTTSHQTRRRFTLAHELCHVLLMRLAESGKEMPLRRYRTKKKLLEAHQDPIEESLCNYFAGELLLPASEVKDWLKNRSVEPQTILNLANQFFVSKQAAAVRAVTLNQGLRACSMWNLQSLWPMPVWWVGRKTRLRSEMEELEALVGRREDLDEPWDSYAEWNRKFRLRIAPVGMQFSLVLVTEIEEQRFLKV